MKELFNNFKPIISFCGATITVLFGMWDTPIRILVLFMVLDYCLGVARGYINKELSSDIGLKGVARKAVIFAVLIVAVALDKLMNTGNWVFRTLVCYFYIANEGLSIVENCGALGLPIPDKLKDALAQLKDGEKKGIKE